MTLRYEFSHRKWLSRDQGDCRTHVTLHPMGDNERRSFDYLFPELFRRDLFDSHLWLSVVKRPRPSVYTRVQRLSTCLALLFLSMVASAMWFGTEPESNPGLKIGPVWISFHTLYVSVIASVVIIPPTIVIMNVFRRTRNRKRKCKPLPNDSSDQRCASGSQVRNSNVPNMIIADPGGDKTCGTKYDSFVDKILEPHNTIKTSNRASEYTKTVDDCIWSIDRSIIEFQQLHQPADDIEDEPSRQKSKCRLRLPWGFVFVGYFLVMASVFVGGFFCIFYSLDWGKEKSHQWLLSILLSSSQDILLLQPVKVSPGE